MQHLVSLYLWPRISDVVCGFERLLWTLYVPCLHFCTSVRSAISCGTVYFASYAFKALYVVKIFRSRNFVSGHFWKCDNQATVVDTKYSCRSIEHSFLCSDTNVTQFGQGLLSLLTCACTCMREKFDYWHLPSSTCFYVVSMGFMRHTENFISVCIKTQLLSSCPVSQTLLILLCILLQCLERKKTVSSA